jgi:hypothetical protein
VGKCLSSRVGKLLQRSGGAIWRELEELREALHLRPWRCKEGEFVDACTLVTVVAQLGRALFFLF